MTTPAILARLSAALADRYTIEREIGEGGMATVFLATDVRHERRVAIKMLHPELSAVLGPERFLSEIKLTASLQHPNILPLFDSGVADGLLYYVMPFVEGETLRKRLERERQLPVADAVKLTTEIADALQYAHERGVVHRDIKPENVLLQGGRAVVADFGIALAVQQAGGTRMTQTGMSLGTPQYMSPEQAMGERNIDARSDIYALGAMTYEMLAGEPPFTGPTAQAIVAKVMTERARPLQSLRDTVPPHVAHCVATALEKLPADRFASAAEFASGLDAANASRYATATRAGVSVSSPTSASRGLLMLVGGGALALGLAVGALLLNRPRDGGGPADALSLQFGITPPDSANLRIVCCGQMFAISPNGRYLVYQGNVKSAQAAGGDSLQNGDRPQHLYVRDLTALSAKLLKETSGATSIFFSPKSDEVAYVRNQQLWRQSIASGESQLVAAVPDGYVGGGSWSDDGQMTLAVSGKMLRVMASGGTLTPVFAPDTTGLQFGGPQMFSREGVLLYTVGGFGVTPTVIWRSLKTGATHVVAHGATPTYVPDQHALVFVRDDGTLVMHPFDLARGDTTGPGVRLATGITRRSPLVIHGEYSLAPNGTLILATRTDRGAHAGLSLVDLSRPDAPARILTEFSFFAQLVFSPDNSRLLVGAANDGAAYSTYVFDLARMASTRIQSDSTWGTFTWSRTGDSIVYSARGNQIVSQALYGSSNRRVLVQMSDWVIGTGRMSVWGDWVAFEASKTGNDARRILVAHRDSANSLRRLDDSQFTESDPNISPDGHWIAFTSTENGRADVFVSAFPVSSGRFVVSTTGGARAVWSADSRTIYFTQNNQWMSASFTPGTPPSIGTPRVIYRRDPWAMSDVSSNGKMLVFGDRVREGDPLALIVRLRATLTKPEQR